MECAVLSFLCNSDSFARHLSLARQHIRRAGALFTICSGEYAVTLGDRRIALDAMGMKAH